MTNHRPLSAALVLALAALSPAAFAHDEGCEHTVSIDEIPAPARDALVKQAGNDEITKVEKEKEKETTIYEAHVQPAQGKAYVIEVDGKGKLVHKGAERD